MAGIKGRSGVPRTPEQRRRKLEAAALGRAVQEMAKQKTAPVPGGELPKGAASIADYDRILGIPRSWTDAKAREQVQAEILANEKLTEEAQQRRGKLLTREQVSKRDQAFDDLLLTQISTVSDLIATVVPADKRALAQNQAAAWIEVVLRALARKPA